MNFLAHIYLSGDNQLIQIGNFMADGIRGKDYESYPIDIQKGIILHRAIDTFTDAHPIFRQSTKKLHERYHHYSGVIVDIFYDHFLAKNWHQYSNIPLEKYTASFYKALQDNYNSLSDKAKRILPLMMREDWLTIYATIEGISHILKQMDRRSGNKSEMQYSVAELMEFYEAFEAEFKQFFEEMREHASQKLLEL